MRIVFPYDGYESLGIGYLAAIAMKDGHEVMIHPLKFGDYIKGYKTRTPGQIEKTKKEILQLKPDVVAFSINSFMAGSLIDLASAVRGSGTKTVAGGPHCTAEPQMTADTNAFDAVIAGEADDVFSHCMENVSKGKPDLPCMFTASGESAEYASVSNLDILPFPAKKLFYNINSYESNDYKIITSRGCIYKCIFCSHSNPDIKSFYRRRSIENVIEELIRAKNEFNNKSVYFLDDVFTVNENWLSDFLREYKRHVNLPFHAISHPSHINDKIAGIMKDANCYALRIGIQTTTEKIAGCLGRTGDNKLITEAVLSVKRKNIKVEIDHIVNLPGETIAEGRQSIRIYNSLRPDSIKVYWLMPLPGTIWFRRAQEQKIITEAQAADIRKGRVSGRHSYLFCNNAFNNSKWLGIHFLLTWLPLLPKSIISFLIKVKADRFLRIPSFSLIVGVPRLLNMKGNWDMVGREHLKRLFFPKR